MLSRRDANIAIISGLALAAVPGLARAQEARVKELPPPQTEGGMPLKQALKARRSTREFADRPLPPQVLSDLLWAAWGLNRPQSNSAGYHTAPTSHNVRDIDLYLTMADGVWIYDPVAHHLVAHMPDDLRGATTTGQDFVRTAPLNLVYVSDAARMGKPSEADRLLNGIADSAVIAQNVYLFCASEGLGTVMRASVPGEQLAKHLNLSSTQAIYFAQTVGYPKG